MTARKTARTAAQPVTAPVAIQSPTTQAIASGAQLLRGRWQDALAGVSCDALIFDAPFSALTHAAATTRSDSSDAAGLTPTYDAFTESDVRELCEAWRGDRCRGWMVSLTDSELAPVWRAEMTRVGRYAFPPVPCVIRGMSVRIQGDGPSSWTLYAMVSRPRSRAFATWGTLEGVIEGTLTDADDMEAPYASLEHALVVANDARIEGRWHDAEQVLAPWVRRLGLSSDLDRAFLGGSGANGRAGGSSRGGGRGKPLWLMEALVRSYSRAGDVVADPFAGWGGTLIAATRNGRSAIGAEMDADAYAEACRRLARPQQVDMFGGAA